MKRKLLTLALSIASATGLHAQSIPLSRYFQNGMYQFSGTDKFPEESFFSTYRDSLGISGDDSFARLEQNLHDNNQTDTRYQQYHKGFIVEDGQYILHGQNGVVLYAAGNIVKSLAVDIPATLLDDSTNLEKVTDAFYPRIFNFQVDSLVRINRENLEDSTLELKPVGSLVLYHVKNADQDSNQYVLARKYYLRVVGDTPMSYIVYSDPVSGAILDSFDCLDHYGYVTGNVETEFDGVHLFRTYKPLIGKYYLRGDYGVDIFSFQGASGKLVDGDNYWSSYSERNTTNSHWAAQKAYEMYRDGLGVTGSDFNGRGVEIHADESNQATSFDPALSQYGNKDYIHVQTVQNNVWHCVLDVIGHELTHAFIRKHSNLDPNHQYWEAGALNEGFADIFGEFNESRFRGYTDWKIGYDSHSMNSGVQYRNLANPHSQTYPGPATYHESGYWNYGTNYSSYVHQNASVISRWFYLTANGTSSMSGVGINTAARLAFNTMIWWLWQNVNYNDAKNQTLACATADFGGTCNYVFKVAKSAFNDVGLPYNVQCRPARISGDRVIDRKALVSGNVSVFDLVSNEDEEQLPGQENITWILPEDWHVNYSPDNRQVTLVSISSTATQTLKAVVEWPSGNRDTIEHIVHFNSCTDCMPAARQQQSGVQGAEQNGAFENVSLYPNPTTSKSFEVDIRRNHFSGASLAIYSFDGKKIMEKQLANARTHVDVPFLNAGLYMLRIEGEGFAETRKLEIQ